MKNKTHTPEKTIKESDVIYCLFSKDENRNKELIENIELLKEQVIVDIKKIFNSLIVSEMVLINKKKEETNKNILKSKKRLNFFKVKKLNVEINKYTDLEFNLVNMLKFIDGFDEFIIELFRKRESSDLQRMIDLITNRTAKNNELFIFTKESGEKIKLLNYPVGIEVINILKKIIGDDKFNELIRNKNGLNYHFLIELL